MDRRSHIIIPLLVAVLHVLAQNIFGVLGDQEDADVCRFTTTEITSDGSAVTRFLEFEPGENVGDVFETRCGSWEDYPCFCAPTLDRQVVSVVVVSLSRCFSLHVQKLTLC